MIAQGGIWSERGGNNEGPLLVFIHGLGANATVWKSLLPLVEANWKGGWVTLDLRGHGRSAPQNSYGVGEYAADIAQLLGSDHEVSIIGHSLGGVIGYALVSGLYDLKVRSLNAIGIKTNWTNVDFERGDALAAQPAKIFDTQNAAIERYLKVAGLFNLIDIKEPDNQVGIVQKAGCYSLASDPRVNKITPLDFNALGAMARSPVHLLCGDQDPIASTEGMARLGAAVTTIVGAGHYPQIESPDKFWDLIQDKL